VKANHVQISVKPLLGEVTYIYLVAEPVSPDMEADIIQAFRKKTAVGTIEYLKDMKAKIPVPSMEVFKSLVNTTMSVGKIKISLKEFIPSIIEKMVIDVDLPVFNFLQKKRPAMALQLQSQFGLHSVTMEPWKESTEPRKAHIHLSGLHSHMAQARDYTQAMLDSVLVTKIKLTEPVHIRTLAELGVNISQRFDAIMKIQGKHNVFVVTLVGAVGAEEWKVVTSLVEQLNIPSRDNLAEANERKPPQEEKQEKDERVEISPLHWADTKVDEFAKNPLV